MKTVIVVNICLLGLLSKLSAATAETPVFPNSPCAGYYTGVIGKTMKVQMVLNGYSFDLDDKAYRKVIKSGLSGKYFYEKYGTWISLNGPKSMKADEIVLDEHETNEFYYHNWYGSAGAGNKFDAYPAPPKNSNKSALLRGQFNNRTGIFSGTWRSSNGRRSYPLKFQRVAVFKELETDLSQLISWPAGSKLRYTGPIVSAYPVLTDFMPRASRDKFNAVIRQTFRKRHEKRVALYKRAWKLIFRYAKEHNLTLAEVMEQDPVMVEPERVLIRFSDLHGSYHDNSQVEYISSDLVSIYSSARHWGHHVRTGEHPMNLWLKNGRVIHVKLADLFRPGSDWHKVFRKELDAVIKKKSYSSKEASLLKDLLEELIKGGTAPHDLRSKVVFTLSPSGVKLYFSRLPQAPASPIIIISHAKLESFIHENGPLARLVK